VFYIATLRAFFRIRAKKRSSDWLAKRFLLKKVGNSESVTPSRSHRVGRLRDSRWTVSSQHPVTKRHKRSRDNASVLFLPRVRTAPEPANRTRHAPSAEACPRRRFAWRVVRLAARSNLIVAFFRTRTRTTRPSCFIPESAPRASPRSRTRHVPSSETCPRRRVVGGASVICARSIDRTNERSSFVTPPASNSTTLRRSRCRHALRPRMSPRRWCSAKPAIPARRRAG
jgi:hypothetical protein